MEDLNYPLFESNVIKGLKLVDGSLPVVHTAKNVHYIKDIKLRSDDVFITGYPKSGTTWLAELVWLLLNQLDYKKSKSLSHYERNHFLDYGLSLDFLESLNSPRVFNTRLPLDYLPQEAHLKSKIVYIMRNPRDMLVSTYHYLAKHKFNQLVGTFDDLLAGFEQGKLWYGPWWDHVNQYMAHQPQIHVIQYENLLERPVESVRELASFLGKEYTTNELESLIAFTSFANIKSVAGFDFNSELDKQMYEKDMSFFRKGQIGDWRNQFSSVEQVNRVDRLVRDKLKFPVEFNYG